MQMVDRFVYLIGSLLYWRYKFQMYPSKSSISNNEKLLLLPVCSFKEGSDVCDVSEVKRSTFGFLLGVGALQLQLLQSGGQIFFLFGGQVLHVETVVIEQQSQPLQ